MIIAQNLPRYNQIHAITVRIITDSERYLQERDQRRLWNSDREDSQI